MFPGQQAIEAVEQRFAAGYATIEKVARQCGTVRLRRNAGNVDEIGQVAAEEQAIAADVIVGETGADKVAIEQHAPRLRIEQGQRETAVEAVDGERAVFEVLAANLFSDAFQIEWAG